MALSCTSCCSSFDKLLCCLTHWTLIIFMYLLYPIKILIGFLAAYFQRPYSLFFLLDFFLLMTTNVLLVVIFIQNYEFINTIETFNKIFYFTLLCSVVNYIIVFHIYHLYGLHSLEKEYHTANVKTYLSHIIKYFFKDTIGGYIGVFFILQSVVFILSLNHFSAGNETYFSNGFAKPVVVYFTQIGVIFNLIFCLIHIGFYFLIFICVICKINNSCIISVLLQLKVQELQAVKGPNSFPFYDLALRAFEFIGIYEMEKDFMISKEVENV
jgi:hypothetical protein